MCLACLHVLEDTVDLAGFRDEISLLEEPGNVFDLILPAVFLYIEPHGIFDMENTDNVVDRF